MTAFAYVSHDVLWVALARLSILVDGRRGARESE
jgi:hypothetical protein